MQNSSPDYDRLPMQIFYVLRRIVIFLSSLKGGLIEQLFTHYCIKRSILQYNKTVKHPQYILDLLRLFIYKQVKLGFTSACRR